MWNDLAHMKKQFALFCLIVGVILHFTTGCEGPTDPGAATTSNVASVLRRGNGGDPRTLDPSLAEDVHAFNVLRDLYEGLVTEAADGSLVPGAARDWNVSDDGLRYTFNLRDDAVWSNGQPVTANEFVASIRRALSSESESPYAFLLYPILNAEGVSAGDLDISNLGVRALDASTLVIELTAPAGFFPGILAMPIAFPLYGAGDFDLKQFADPGTFVGNGPYVLKEWQPGSRIRLGKNLQFRAADSVSVETIEYFSIEEPNTELTMYRAGELDITATIPPAQFASMRLDRPDEVLISPGLALYYIAFDLSEPPMDNLALRQALTMAIDREMLVDIIGRGERPAFGIVPDNVAGHRSARYSWQKESQEVLNRRAKALYVQAGYGPANPLQFTLMYDVGDIHETVALAVTSMWRDVLGAEVTLDKREWQYFLDTRNNREDWQAMRFAWFGDYNDASTFLDIFHSDSAQNLSGFHSQEYDELLDVISQTLDSDQRSENTHRAETHLLNANPVIPLYFFVSKHLVSPRVRNYQPNILDVHRSQYIELKREE